MKSGITFWENSYNLGTFGRNVREYGLAASLKHDLDQTNEDFKDGLENILVNIFFGVVTIAGFLVSIYGPLKANIKSSEEEKERKRLAEARGGEK
ncbi:MAG: hypothetical protein AABX79_02200 [Nanoarchaeota archaeon]